MNLNLQNKTHKWYPMSKNQVSVPQSSLMGSSSHKKDTELPTVPLILIKYLECTNGQYLHTSNYIFSKLHLIHSSLGVVEMLWSSVDF